MARLFSILLWTGVFLLLLLGIDQLLVRVPASQPTHAAIAAFYRDLRGRLFDLATTGTPPRSPATVKKPALPAPAPKKAPPASIEAVIEQRQTQQPAAAAATGPRSAPPAPAAAKPPAAEPSADSIEAVIDRRRPAPTAEPVKTKAAPVRPVPVETTRRYLYADEQGNLHFAATLAEVPERYRTQAKLVGE